MLESRLQKIIAIVVGVIAIGGSAFKIERYFAKQKSVTVLEEAVAETDKKFATVQDVAVLSKDIVLNSLENARIRLEQRIWNLQERYSKTRDAVLLRIIQGYQKDLEDLEQRIRDKRND